jgi:hypothetical protein
MGRQMLAVALGIVVSFLAAVGGGYFLYRLSSSLGDQAPVVARYILNPVIALLVGICVGALAKSRAGILAGLSLAPWAFGFLFAQRQDASHFFVLALLDLLYLLVGMAVAAGTFRMRTRNAPSALVTT